MNLRFITTLVATAELAGASSIRSSSTERELNQCPFINTAAEPCCAFFVLAYDTFNFQSYSTYHDDDSTFTLAQAGVYKGAAAIEEYVKFASPFSPYFASVVVPFEFEESFKGFDGSTCVFSNAGPIRYTFEQSTTGSSESFLVVSGSNLYFNVQTKKIDKVDLYYGPGFLEYFFQTLQSPEANNLICETMGDTCGYNIGTKRACVNRLSNALPVLEDGYFDGDSQGCRVLHTALAISNPDLHCPHINLKAEADSNGNTKCFESSNIDPDDLFDDDDYEIFNATCIKYGIDPDIGYIID